MVCVSPRAAAVVERALDRRRTFRVPAPSTGTAPRCPYHHVVDQGVGSTEVVTVLIDAGADMNDKDADGKMPLHSAAQIESKKVATVLIDDGADVNTKQDKDGPRCTGPLTLTARKSRRWTAH